ncbi:GSCOCG00003605001-RA-CDS [Cotesia congregata]|nr:GSCOCG00003605001-RA-CDS [Cotesia congregata]
MSPKYLYLIIATIGCISAVPYDQRFAYWQRRTDPDDISGVIPIDFSDSFNNAAANVDTPPKHLTDEDFFTENPVDANRRRHFQNLNVKNRANHHITVENNLPSLYNEGVNLDNEEYYKNVDNRHLPKFPDSSVNNEADNIIASHKIVNNHMPNFEGPNLENENIDIQSPSLLEKRLDIENRGVGTEKSENNENKANDQLLSLHGLSSEGKSDYQHIGDAILKPYQASEPKTSSDLVKNTLLKTEEKDDAIPKSIVQENESSDNKDINLASEHQSSRIQENLTPSKLNFENFFQPDHQNDLNSPEKSRLDHKTNEEEEKTATCPNVKNKNHITKIFAKNISSLPFEDDLKGRFDPDSSKSTKVYVGEDVTVCWTEITTIKENSLLASPNRQVIREYAISFENSAIIPDEYIECSKMEGEIFDDSRICDSKFPSTIDQDTRKSKLINTTTRSREGDLDVTQIKVIKCGVGSLVTREVFEMGKNESKRIEIKVSPLTKKPEDCEESKETPKLLLKECSEEVCNVKYYDDIEDDKVSSTGAPSTTLSSTPKLEESSKTEIPDSTTILYFTETIKTSLAENYEASSSTEPSTLLEPVTKSLEVSPETLQSDDQKEDLQTTSPHYSYSDYSETGSGDCSEETVTDEGIPVEPNDDHARIDKADIDIVRVPLVIHVTEPNIVNVERRSHELRTTSGTRRSTLPIISSIIDEKGEKHQLALKIKVSLEQINSENPRKIANIERNLTLEEPLSDHENNSLLQQLDALNRSGDSLEAIKEILNSSLLDRFSKDITSTEKTTYRKESEQDFNKLIDDVSEAIGQHKEGRRARNKRSINEGVEKLGSWSNERFMNLESGKQLHRTTELTLFRNFND